MLFTFYLIQLFQFRKPQILFTFNLKKKKSEENLRPFSILQKFKQISIIFNWKNIIYEFLRIFFQIRKIKVSFFYFSIELSINSDWLLQISLDYIPGAKMENLLWEDFFLIYENWINKPPSKFSLRVIFILFIFKCRRERYWFYQKLLM